MADEKQDLRARLLAAPTKRATALHVDPEFGPMVFQRPGFKSALKLDDLEQVDAIVFLLLNCLFQPVLGKDGEPLIGEDGQPLAGKPIFTKADEEVLRDTDWPDDHWFIRVVGALGTWIRDAREVEGLGKSQATD